MNGKIIGVVVALAAVVAIVWSMRSGGGDAVTEPIQLDVGDMQQLAAMAQGIHRGSDDAPITILEFADFQCPGCGSFAGTVMPQVDVGFIEPGTVKFVFYDFPLVSIHPHAFLAARAARCANDQGRFWDFHDELFRNQTAWALSVSSPVGAFEDYAARVGLNQGTFRSCLRSDAHAETVSATMLLGQGLGVTGTPTVLISRGNGQYRQVGAPSIPEMYLAIQAEVGALLAEIEREAGGAQ